MKKTAIIKSLIASATAFILCIFQSYAGMYEYVGKMSSNCMECFYIEELAPLCLIQFILLFPFCYFVFSGAKIISRTFLILLAVGYMAICVFINHEMFVLRVSSWSTFTTSEELFYVFTETSWAILLSAIVLVWLVMKLNKNSKINSQ